MKVTAIPALADNYIWVIEQEKQAVIIDPGESQVVFDYLHQHQLTPIAILLTHNHDDHTAGVKALAQQFPSIVIYGSPELVDFADTIVQPLDSFTLLGHQITVLDSRGHTSQHISYLVDNAFLFCGDSLFSAGCGRVFTQDYQAQFTTLMQFRSLPDDVNVYPAHEYTLSNLHFASAVIPDSEIIREYQAKTAMLRQQNLPSLPTTIGIEKQINPFLRASSAEEFKQLRLWKDNF